MAFCGASASGVLRGGFCIRPSEELPIRRYGGAFHAAIEPALGEDRRRRARDDLVGGGEITLQTTAALRRSMILPSAAT